MIAAIKAKLLLKYQINYSDNVIKNSIRKIKRNKADDEARKVYNLAMEL